LAGHRSWLQFQDNPLKLLQQGLNQFRNKIFGIKLASLTHYVVTKPEGLEAIPKDEHEVKFSLHEFLRAINFDLITLKENFDSDLHTRLIRTWLCDPSNLKRLVPIIDCSAQDFLKMNPLTQKAGDEVQLDGLNNYFTKFIAYVVSRCVVGPAGFDNEELLQRFTHFNDKRSMPWVMQAFYLAFLSSFLDTRSRRSSMLLESRRNKLPSEGEREVDFMKLAIPFVHDNQRIADLIMIMVWGSLTNLQSTFSSTAWDIIKKPGLQQTLDPAYKADPTTLSVFDRQEPRVVLRSTMFESIRLCGCGNV
jgi:peroxidase